jgi:hypothetical protein
MFVSVWEANTVPNVDPSTNKYDTFFITLFILCFFFVKSIVSFFIYPFFFRNSLLLLPLAFVFMLLGLIGVPHPSVGSRAVQRTKENVCVHSEPAMDVYAKDSECFHGTAIGGIELEVLHYFFWRGMEELVAHELFISGFFD